MSDQPLTMKTPTGETIEIPVSDRAPTKRAPKEDRVKIRLEHNDRIPKVGLNIGHNGTNYLLKTGVDINIPRKVLNVLNDAVASMPIIDPENQTIIGYEDRMMYPYRLVN
ncbi:MAG: hypothetical protein RLZZ200_2986 [Pseudomonadota bacterium]|jgi:hypothetical protein